MRSLVPSATAGEPQQPAAASQALPSHYPPPDAGQLLKRAELYGQLAMLASNAETANRLKALAERFAGDAEAARQRGG